MGCPNNHLFIGKPNGCSFCHKCQLALVFHTAKKEKLSSFCGVPIYRDRFWMQVFYFGYPRESPNPNLFSLSLARFLPLFLQQSSLLSYHRSCHLGILLVHRFFYSNFSSFGLSSPFSLTSRPTFASDCRPLSASFQYHLFSHKTSIRDHFSNG
jgi:hypothetical protein